MDTAKSCYVLEFSVQPGGARLGDVHVYGSLSELRAAFNRRYLVEEHGVDGHLLLWCGAILHLWAVDHGTVVAGIDLRQYLRTGDEEHDRLVQRLVDGDVPDELWDAFDNQLTVCDYEPMRALPGFVRLLELHRTGAQDELRELCAELEAAADANDFTLEEDYPKLVLDWAAAEAALPALPGPMLATGEVLVVWPESLPPHPEGYVKLAFNEDGAAELHAGLNDLECGDDEYPEVVAVA